MSRDLDHSPAHLLHRAGQCAEQLFVTTIDKLTPRQLAVLAAVAQREGESQLALSEPTGIDRSTLADIVWRMQRKGLLQRQRTREYVRAYAVKLTDEGRRVLRAAEPLAEHVDKQILEALPVRSRARFVESLLSIIESVQPRESSKADGTE